MGLLHISSLLGRLLLRKKAFFAVLYLTSQGTIWSISAHQLLQGCKYVDIVPWDQQRSPFSFGDSTTTFFPDLSVASGTDNLRQELYRLAIAFTKDIPSKQLFVRCSL